MIEEAKLQETPGGLEPAGEGWFVVNVRDTKWAVHDHFGAGCRFESRQAFFKEFGINISVLQPGEPSCSLPRGERAGGLPRPERRVQGDRQRRGADAAHVGPLPLAGRDGAPARRRRRRPLGACCRSARGPSPNTCAIRARSRRRATTAVPRRRRPRAGRRTPASSDRSPAGRTAGTSCPGPRLRQLAAPPPAISLTRSCSVRSRRKRPGSPAT